MILIFLVLVLVLVIETVPSKFEDEDEDDWKLLPHRFLDQLHQIGVGVHGFELREFLLHFFRRVDEETGIRLQQHRGVVVGVAGGMT